MDPKNLTENGLLGSGLIRPLHGLMGGPAAGPSGSLLLVRSSLQYAVITDAQQTGLESADDFTVEGCFQLTSLPGSGEIYALIHKGTGTNGTSYALDIEETGGSHRIRFYFRSPSQAKVYVLGWAVSLSTDTPYYVGLAYDSSAQVNQTTLVFGEVGSVADQGAPSMIAGGGTDVAGPSINASGDFRLGYRQDVSARAFDGLLDEWRFWDVLRTPTELSDNHNVELSPGSYSGLQGYWQCNENDGGKIVDRTSNMNDLTMENGASIVETSLI